MAGASGAPEGSGGVGDDDRRYVAYAIFLGLAILFVTIVMVVVTSVGGDDEPADASAERQAPRSGPAYWTVRRGDTYSAIAQRTGLSVDDLETFNRTVDPSTIQPGQRLKLRAKVPSPKRKPLGPKTVVVRAGDSFGSIAAKTGRSITRLQQLNSKLKPSELQPGDRVRLR